MALVVGFLMIAAAGAAMLPQAFSPAATQNAQVCSGKTGAIRRDADSISIDGFLDESIYRCFQKLYSPDVRIIEVRSSGGTPEGALGIAEKLALDRPIVRVHDFCASACAYLLLPVASEIEATQNSIVLFHHTATSTYESLGEDPRESSGRFKPLYNREMALYRKVRVSPWLLRAPFAAQEPVCEITGRVFDGKPSADYEARFKAVLIDKRNLARAGLNLPATVVSTLPELLTVAHGLPDQGASLLKGGITYLSAPSEERGNKPLPVLPRCTGPAS